MIYTVLKIEEDLDYGCEERNEDQPILAVVTLQSPDGEERICKVPDAFLYTDDILEGDRAYSDRL